MLELRPNCECCNKDLPANATDAMICSFECTFCKKCVTDTLHNVCPNCGGGFSIRPIRPVNNLKNENYLSKYPASTNRVNQTIDKELHRQFADSIQTIPPEKR